jgi:hypothetical protein
MASRPNGSYVDMSSFIEPPRLHPLRPSFQLLSVLTIPRLRIISDDIDG